MKDKDGHFVPGEHEIGVDSLIQSLLDNGVRPNSNVYAELGTTWRYLMHDPDEAAHVMGKLFRYVGEITCCGAPISIWYGSPQDQIQAFRTFQISTEYQEKFGYAAITPELRAKVFGLNALKPYGLDGVEVRKSFLGDAMQNEKARNAEQPDPTFMTYGPQTRREFLALLKAGG